jgi:hypothetical protein
MSIFKYINNERINSFRKNADALIIIQYLDDDKNGCGLCLKSKRTLCWVLYFLKLCNILIKIFKNKVAWHARIYAEGGFRVLGAVRA